MSALSAFDGMWGSSSAAPTPPAPAPSTLSTSTASSPLHDRAIIVTGCGSGIGRATAILLAERGARLALTDLDAQAGRELCQEIKRRGYPVDMVFAALDCTDENAVGKLMRTFKKSYKRLDGIVNCAGIDPASPESHLVEFDLYQRTMDVNVKGSFAFSKHFAAAAVKDAQDDVQPPAGGYSIVNLGATASLTGIENSSVYCASKHAVLGFSRAIAKEYAANQVRCNVVCPGPIDTPLLHAHYAAAEGSDLSLDDAIERVPMKRIGQPEEVARVIAFLLGYESSYVTGAAIPVDGGATA